MQHGGPLDGEQRLGQGQERVEPRVSLLVDGVPEPGKATVAAQEVVDGGGRHHRASALTSIACACSLAPPCRRSREGGQAGRQRAVHVGPRRGSHPDRQRRGRQLMVRHEDEGGVHGGGQPRWRVTRGTGQPARQPRGDRIGGVLVDRSLPHHRHERGHDTAGRPLHGGRAQVGPLLVAPHRFHHQGPLHGVGHRGQRAGADAGIAPVAARVALPQQRGDLFERQHARERHRRTAAVEGTVGAQLRHAGGDGGQPGLVAAPAALAGRQPLNVGELEHAPPAPLGAVRGEESPADVGVERGELDPEAAGRLLARDQSRHGPTLH